MNQQTAALGARLRLSGTLVFKDASGAVLKSVEMTGSVPLSDTGLTVEQAQELINSQEPHHGSDDCK